jgi:hypothetical protein
MVGLLQLLREELIQGGKARLVDLVDEIEQAHDRHLEAVKDLEDELKRGGKAASRLQQELEKEQLEAFKVRDRVAFL